MRLQIVSLLHSIKSGLIGGNLPPDKKMHFGAVDSALLLRLCVQSNYVADFKMAVLCGVTVDAASESTNISRKNS